MKMLITTLLMIFSLNACRSFEQQVICKEIDSYQIKPTPMCDISFQFSRCRCRCFDFNKWETIEDISKCGDLQTLVEKRAKISWISAVSAPTTRIVKLDLEGKVSETYQAKDFPLEYCEGVAGAFLPDIAKNIRPNIKALNNVKEKLCR